MKQVALEAAETKENLADIINCVIEEVFHQRFELPGYQKLVRLSRAARTVVNNRNYHKISASLSKAQKKYIDKIISLNADKAPDEWAWIALKQEPRSPTQNNIKQFIGYVKKLSLLRKYLPIDVEFIAPARLEHLRDEAMVTDQADMRKISGSKRYALVVILPAEPLLGKFV